MPEVEVEEARRFMIESLAAGGAPQREAEAHADLLLHADVAGHFSHGMNRLGSNAMRFRAGFTLRLLRPISASVSWRSTPRASTRLPRPRQGLPPTLEEYGTGAIKLNVLCSLQK